MWAACDDEWLAQFVEKCVDELYQRTLAVTRRGNPISSVW